MVGLIIHHKLQVEKHHVIPHYEGLDVVGKATLLADAKISSLVKPLNGV